MKTLRTILVVVGLALVVSFLKSPRESWREIQRGYAEHFDPGPAR